MEKQGLVPNHRRSVDLAFHKKIFSKFIERGRVLVQSFGYRNSIGNYGEIFFSSVGAKQRKIGW